MLRNRTRTVTTKKQSVMADQTPSPVSKFINDYFSKKTHEIEINTPSPTSILDSQQFSPVGYGPKIISKSLSCNFRDWDNEKPKRLGLALVDSLVEKPENVFSKKVLFGSKLKIEIPPSVQEPKSPSDFGTKTRNSPSPFGKLNNFNSPKVFDISTSEMESSEEYTRVIEHGPSPRTIHIYDDCVLESCNGVVGLSELKRQLSLPNPVRSNSGFENFLSFCSNCKKRLDHGKDIYMYRGEKGFCSHECRFKEMLSDGDEDFKII